MNPYFSGLNNPIEKAETPPGAMYCDKEFFETLSDRVFFPNTFWLGHQSDFSPEINVFPVTCMPGSLNEPLILVRGKSGDFSSLLSNVCTHRAARIVSEPSKLKRLICPYHGRRWDLLGQFQFMPGFESALDFPRDCDHLKKHELVNWKGLLLGKFAGQVSDSSLQLLFEIMDFFPLESLKAQAGEPSAEYTIPVNWALYCENYLEGFHIPFVHPGLNEALDIDDYPIESEGKVILQTGMADKNTSCFDLPKEHRDYGKRIGAYYFFLFPGLMLNFYPWGLSVNEVLPNSVSSTVIKYSTYLLPGAAKEGSAGAALDEVEFEDQTIVQKVQDSIGSRYYPGGRYSPKHEKGVYYFHKMLADCFNQ